VQELTFFLQAHPPNNWLANVLLAHVSKKNERAWEKMESWHVKFLATIQTRTNLFYDSKLVEFSNNQTYL
jgi:hypothetical protein